MDKIICGNCGETLEVDKNKDLIICEQCGCQLFKGIEFVDKKKNKKVLDAEKYAYELEKEKLRMEEEYVAGRAVAKSFIGVGYCACIGGTTALFALNYIVAGVFLALVTFIGAFVFLIRWLSNLQKNNVIVIRKALSKFEGLNYKDVKKMYIDEGFKDVSLLSSHVSVDKVAGGFKLEDCSANGLVLEVLINDRVVEAGDTFRVDDKVVIKYLV